MDKTDISILRMLQADYKRSVKSIASELHLTSTPVFERIKKMEREGIIDKYSLKINPEALGLNLRAFCTVSLEAHDHTQLNRFAKEIKALDEVIACYHVTGPFDYLLHILVEDMEAYQQFVIQKLSKMSSIRQVQSFFVMNELISSDGFRLDHLTI
mgnify:CR=1 FL=1